MHALQPTAIRKLQSDSRRKCWGGSSRKPTRTWHARDAPCRSSDGSCLRVRRQKHTHVLGLWGGVRGAGWLAAAADGSDARGERARERARGVCNPPRSRSTPHQSQDASADLADVRWRTVRLGLPFPLCGALVAAAHLDVDDARSGHHRERRLRRRRQEGCRDRRERHKQNDE